MSDYEIGLYKCFRTVFIMIGTVSVVGMFLGAWWHLFTLISCWIVTLLINKEIEKQ